MKNEIRRLGNLYREDAGGTFAGNVYDSKAVAPTIITMTGGGRQPMIVEITKIERNNEGNHKR